MNLLAHANLDLYFTAAFPGAEFKYHVKPEDGLGGRLFWQSWRLWEPQVVPQFARLLRPDSRVLDVGANTGVYTLFACALNESVDVFSFEPVPFCYERMQENVELNGFCPRCRLFRSAVSDRSGSIRFHIHDDDLTQCCVSDSGELEVPVVKIDEVVPMDGRTSLVKIDVELHEHKVLSGMVRLLKNCHPAILFECNPHGEGWCRCTSEQRCVTCQRRAEIAITENILRTEGYRIFRMEGGKVFEVGQKLDPWQSAPGNHNYLALCEQSA